MRIPYVIDNQQHKLTDVLNILLQSAAAVQHMDVATAYFNPWGYALLRDGLAGLKGFRLLIPKAGIAQLRDWLGSAHYTADLQAVMEDLIRFIQADHVQVHEYLGHAPEDSSARDRFLHAKCYLLYGGRGSQLALLDRLNPLVGIVGSSNFTRGGLLDNHELNVTHKTLLDIEEVNDEAARNEVAALSNVKLHNISLESRQAIKSEVGARAILDLCDWYDRQWTQGHDIKADLIDVLDSSKFGEREYTPWQIYMKALYEYFRDDLDSATLPYTRSIIDLSEFQDDAVKKARRILARHDGVIIADSVGMGKTWIGKKLLEDSAYFMRQQALVICPAALRPMWQRELQASNLPAQVLTQESLGQASFDYRPYSGASVILIDEAHNFRNRNAQRYENLERLLATNNRRGVDNSRRKLILLTATPITNDLFDLYNIIALFTGGDRSYFSGTGIGDLYRYFLDARRERTTGESTASLFNLLEEIVIRRTRPFIRRAYPNATIQGKKISWPERRLKTLRYNLEATYIGIYDDIVRQIERLNLAPYNLESFKRQGVALDDLELGRQEALVGIFKSRYLKRFESSVEAFRITVRRALEFLKTFDSYVREGKVLDSSSFQKALRMIDTEDDEDTVVVANEDDNPTSRATEIDVSAEARAIIDELPPLDPKHYDLRRLGDALQKDIEALTDIWYRIKSISPNQDAKLKHIKETLVGDLRGKKVLIFTYYRDTARYLFRQLVSDPDWLEQAGQPVIKRVDGGVENRRRVRLVQRFAPVASGFDLTEDEQEIQIIVATDVLSEGQNLQDCGLLINYDLHWSPTRMVQRAGRVDRIGSPFETLWIYNMFPEEGLERLLGLVETLSNKIDSINRLGMLDASILGEAVNPRNFNTLRRIQDEDGTVIEEQEQFIELASSESLMQTLRDALAGGMSHILDDLPDGIHSGLGRHGERGIFFYFTAPAAEGGRQHFWRYIDLATGRIEDNRLRITALIQCQPDTARLEGTADVFDLQKQVIHHILQSAQQQQALEAAPKRLDTIQQTAGTILRDYLNSASADREQIRALRKWIMSPMPTVYIKTIRSLVKDFDATHDVQAFILGLNQLKGVGVPEEAITSNAGSELSEDDLHLICFDYVWS